MRYGPDEEAEYFAARDQLVADFRAWKPDAPERGYGAETLLDFKWGYDDGDLLTWRIEHVDEVLIDWMPRKVLVDDDEAIAMAMDIAEFFVFLDATGRLGPRSHPVAELVDRTHELGAGLGRRMRDPGHWSMGKALLSAMEAEGHDVGDQAAMDAWIRDFNSRPLHEREAITGPAPPLPGDEEPVELSPRPRPEPEEVEATAAAARVLGQMLALSDFFGEGRPLTKKGNLKLADARTLVEMLDTGDQLDETIGDHTYHVRSAEDLPELDGLVEWAKAARVVRVVKGSLQGTAAFRKLARDPVAGLDRLVDVLFEAGPLLARRPWVVPVLAGLEVFVDAAVTSVVMAAYDSDQPLDFDTLVVDIAAQAVRFVDLPEWMTPESVEDLVRRDLADALRGLGDTGVLIHSGFSEREHRFETKRVHGGAVALTAYGIATVQRLAPELGAIAPVIQPFTATADAEPAVVIRALAEQLDAGGPAALVGSFDRLGPAGPELIERCWRTDDPSVLAVLEALGRHHLDRPTAKGARKAALQHRSWIANRA